MHATFFKSVSRNILCARLLYSRINMTFNARELFRKWNSRLSRLFMRATFYAFKVIPLLRFLPMQKVLYELYKISALQAVLYCGTLFPSLSEKMGAGLSSNKTSLALTSEVE